MLNYQRVGWSSHPDAHPGLIGTYWWQPAENDELLGFWSDGGRAHVMRLDIEWLEIETKVVKNPFRRSSTSEELRPEEGKMMFQLNSLNRFKDFLQKNASSS